MTAIITRTDPTTTVDYRDEDDGCPVGSHYRDELCARTRIAAPAEPEPDECGEVT